jgi:hypothetical protein
MALRSGEESLSVRHARHFPRSRRELCDRDQRGQGCDTKSTLYTPGSSAFQRLVDRIIATGIHEVDDLDHNPARESEEIARKWVESLGAKAKGVELDGVSRSFGGTALLRVRATVAHDSYERLDRGPEVT